MYRHFGRVADGKTRENSIIASCVPGCTILDAYERARQFVQISTHDLSSTGYTIYNRHIGGKNQQYRHKFFLNINHSFSIKMI